MHRLFVLILLIAVASPAEATYEFLKRFLDDPLRSANAETCAVCHDDDDGGGPLNEFGTAFDTAGREITPLLRVDFPDLFGFYSTKLADGSTFHFADPASELAVFERGERKVIVDLLALAAEPEDIPPPPANRMSFFVTSVGVGNGGHLGGLAGADRHCQTLAEAAGSIDQTWRAYLSTSWEDEPGVHAGNRIGAGPWYNAKGVLVARGVADLHHENRLSKQTALDENGAIVFGRGDETNRHDILTGTLPDGTAAVGMNCNNWTSAGEGQALVGHHDREGGGDQGSSWNAAHSSQGCRQEDFEATGGAGLFYCFAVRQ